MTALSFLQEDFPCSPIRLKQIRDVSPWGTPLVFCCGLRCIVTELLTEHFANGWQKDPFKEARVIWNKVIRCEKYFFQTLSGQYLID